MSNSANKKYLVYGEDSFRARQFIKSINPNLSLVDSDREINKSIIELNQHQLFSATSENIVGVIFRDLTKQLRPHLQTIAQSPQTVVIWETSAKKPLTKKHLQQIPQLQVKEFKPLKPYEVTGWLKKHAQSYQIKLSTPAIQTLVKYHSTDLTMLDNELKKLSLYAQYHKMDQIDAKTVSKLCSATADLNIFDLTDAVGNRNKSKLMPLLQEIYQKNTDEWYIFYMITKHIRELLAVKINSPIKLHPFVKKKLNQQIRHWQEDELITSLQKLLEIEFNLKRGAARSIMPGLYTWLIKYASAK